VIKIKKMNEKNLLAHAQTKTKSVHPLGGELVEE
jgi:hypothetical protein